jgi:hypothetical protein
MDRNAFPLTWPDGWPRTRPDLRERGTFKITFDRARQELRYTLKLLGARDAVLSSDVALRLDGEPRAGMPEPKDPGVAVYFVRQGQKVAMACDRYRTVRDNMRGLGLALEAIRTLERHGTKELLDRAFRGYAALPAAGRPWYVVLGVKPDCTRDELEAAWKRCALETHPDRGGTAEAFDEVAKAYAIGAERFGG